MSKLPCVKGMIKVLRTTMHTEYTEVQTLEGYRCRKCDTVLRGRELIDKCRELDGCVLCHEANDLFRERVKNYLDAGLSREDLAVEFEVATSTVSRWVNGTSKPHPRIALQIGEWVVNRMTSDDV